MTPVHSLWLIDLLDILLVAALFYRFLIAVKGTRSAQMYVGLLMIVLVAFLSRQFDLIAVRWIAESLKTVWLIAFVIIFQPELRHALAQFGRTRYFRSFLQGDDWAYTAGIVAILIGAALVFFLFPQRRQEEELLADYGAEDAAAP